MNLRTFLKTSGRGSVTKISNAIEVPTSLMSDWANRRRPIPIGRCIAIERATNGLVSRRDLRPDDWHLIWPELATEPAKKRRVT
jgi:DNA-binding transcriptional regulator YdaS (Cro superfamily)